MTTPLTQDRLRATISTTRVTVPASKDGPALPATMHRQTENGAAGWIIWAHGGSWHQGSSADWQHATGLLASLSGRNVLSLDYRLAPTHRHAAAVIDMLTAIGWVRETSPDSSIIVGGDSAGGTLAAVAAIAARDRGESLQAQILAYPPIDPECRAVSYHADPGSFPPPGLLRTAWRSWHGTPQASAVASDGTRLLFSPREADSLAGVAPAVLVVGDHDPVRDDVAAYAEQLRADGVPVDHRVLPGIGHGDVLRPASAVIGALAAALTDFPREHTQRKEASS